MDQALWQLSQPMDAIIFDCDGTLSRIEGIDFLAEKAGVGKEVCLLTERAMAVTGITPELFFERMDLVKPTLHQLVELGQCYFENRIHDAATVVEAFLSAGKSVYVISAGLNPSVKIFAALLQIPEENVYAVDVSFDASGRYVDFDHDAPTIGIGGKRKIIEKLSAIHPRLLFVGDGMNDVEASDAVERFVGFGGFRFRDSIVKCSDFYIKSASFASLLLLGLVSSEIERLPASLLKTVHAGLSQIQLGEVILRNGGLIPDSPPV
jgi:phosphoserine phosphatase